MESAADLGARGARARLRSLRRDRRYEEARKLFAALPETTESLNGLARACHATGDLAAAIAAMRRAAELDPERFDLRLALDQMLIEAGAR